MKRLPQFPSILAICCFCLLQNPSSGCPRPLDDSPDGLNIVQLKLVLRIVSNCKHLRHGLVTKTTNIVKDDQGKYKRFLFHYSRTQEPTHTVKTGSPPLHPLTRLAAKLASGRMKRLLRQASGASALGFSKDHIATGGQPFFLFRPRNGRNTEDNTQ